MSLLSSRLCSFLFATVNLLWLGIMLLTVLQTGDRQPTNTMLSRSRAAASHWVASLLPCRCASIQLRLPPCHRTQAQQGTLALLSNHRFAPVAPGQCSDCLGRHVAPLHQFSSMVPVWLLVPHMTAAAGFCRQAWHPASARQ